MAVFPIAALRKLVDGIIIVLYAFMCVAIFAQVMGRYLFNFSIGDFVEGATFAQVWMVMLGSGVAMRLNMHNSMGLFSERLSAPVYRLMMVVSAGACLWFLLITALGGLPLMRIGGLQLSPALEIPMSWIYAAVPIGCAYFALEVVLFTISRVKAGQAPEQTIDDILE